MTGRQDEFRNRWPADEPWCDAHWRPRSVCAQCPRDLPHCTDQPHSRGTDSTGPDYCEECSRAAQDYVLWPCNLIAPAHRAGSTTETTPARVQSPN